MAGKNLEVVQQYVGVQSPVVWFEVEKGAIRKFADAIGDPNPLYRDDEFARRSRHGGIIAPPTFATTFREGLRIEIPNLIGPRLHGEQLFTYQRPLKAGDKLALQTRVAEVKEKKSSSGYLTFIVYETEGHDEAGSLVYTERRTAVMVSDQ